MSYSIPVKNLEAIPRRIVAESLYNIDIQIIENGRYSRQQNLARYLSGKKYVNRLK